MHKRGSQIYILAEGGDVIEQRIRTEPERFAAVLGAGPAPDGRALRSRLPRAATGRPRDTGGEELALPPRALDSLCAAELCPALEPWELPEARPDEARVATIVEGSTPDAEMASFVFIEERGAGRFFAAGSSLGLMTLVEPAAALAALDASGLFTPGSLRTRPLVHIV